MKTTYTQKLTINFCIFLAAFSIGIIIFQQYEAKKYKTEALKERLDGYTEIAYKYLQKYSTESNNLHLDTLLAVLPANLRLTIINPEGSVLYDNRLDNTSELDNHLQRPEIIAAEEVGNGSNIRISSSNQKEYLYYAKHLGNYYIRVALPYDIQVQHFLKPDNGFLYFIIILFILGILLIYFLSKRFGKIIIQLKDYSYALTRNLPVNMPQFPNDEIGDISKQIAKDYKRLKESETKLALEHEKLLMHINSLAEGVCFFSEDRKVAFYNGLFLQYLNMLSDNIVTDPSDFLKEKIFTDIYEFVTRNSESAYFETQINKNGKNFIARVNIFEDQSFEIVLNDNTRQEKNKLLKQEMTGNIAHELRTPVTGIRGYLETVLENKLDKEKEREFISKAYEQIITLSELIRDMGLLSKLNETPDSFQFNNVKINNILERVKSDLANPLREKDIILHSTIPSGLIVAGNESLIYSVFRNLIDNVINHAGESITINIRTYDQQGKFAYFSFSDNGAGVEDEKHLSRLFERFYRISEGRTRETGGSGLGLAIVKNIIAFHGGTISVKKSVEGGLEFLFNLPVK